MQFTDGTWTFDTEIIDALAKNQQRDEQEREMLNALARYAYTRYKQIRDQVKEQLKSPAKRQRVSNLLNITEEEVYYIVDFVKKYLKYVK